MSSRSGWKGGSGFTRATFSRTPCHRRMSLLWATSCTTGVWKKRQLIAKAHAALPKGGALIVYESIIDDERRQNTVGLLSEPEHVDQHTSRFRLHWRGLQRLDARRRIQ